MARTTKYIAVKGSSTAETPHGKHYGESSFVAKKAQAARETLQKFPVPENYAK